MDPKGLCNIFELIMGKRKVGFKQVYMTKIKADRSIKAFKTKFKANVFTYREGIDYSKIMFPLRIHLEWLNDLICPHSLRTIVYPLEHSSPREEEKIGKKSQ